MRWFLPLLFVALVGGALGGLFISPFLAELMPKRNSIPLDYIPPPD